MKLEVSDANAVNNRWRESLPTSRESGHVARGEMDHRHVNESKDKTEGNETPMLTRTNRVGKKKKNQKDVEFNSTF